jgi:hypothetical protein
VITAGGALSSTMLERPLASLPVTIRRTGSVIA